MVIMADILYIQMGLVVYSFFHDDLKGVRMHGMTVRKEEVIGTKRGS